MPEKQTNIGSNNLNIDLSHVNIYINETQNYHEISLKTFFEEYKKKFKELDEIINNQFSTQMIVNKTGAYEAYSTQKIITSLAKIGIPLEITYYIAETVAKEIIEKVETKTITELSTKQIRKIVSKAIQNYNGKDYSLQDIEEWNEKYIRRYGHNNQLVKIYDEKSCVDVDVSYGYIYDKLLPDIVESITNNTDYSKLSNSQKSDLAEEVLDFINNCSLYRINYNVLKSIIIEIAMQPPHPWFVNEDTRKTIMEYDEKQLQINLQKLRKLIQKKTADTSFQYIIFEVLHHGSSLLLAKYNHFLGVKDTSAFFILQNLLKQLEKPDCCDLLLTNYSIANIFADLSFANVDINKFLPLINEIAEALNTRNINVDLAAKVECFGEYINQIIISTNKSEAIAYISEAWCDLDSITLFTHIKKLLYTIAPYRRFNTNISTNFFWMNYRNCWLGRKEKIMVYVSHRTENHLEVVKCLSSYDSRSICDTLIVIAESKSEAISVRQKIQEEFKKDRIDSYIVVAIDKNDLREIAESNQKITLIQEIFEDQFMTIC